MRQRRLRFVLVGLAGLMLLPAWSLPVHGGELRAHHFVTLELRFGDEWVNSTVDTDEERRIRGEMWRLLQSGGFNTKATPIPNEQADWRMADAGVVVAHTARPVSFDTHRFDAPKDVTRMMFPLDVDGQHGLLCTADWCHEVGERRSRGHLAHRVQDHLDP